MNSVPLRNAECGSWIGKPFHREDANALLSQVFRSFSRPLRFRGSSCLIVGFLLSTACFLLFTATPVFALSGRDVYENVHDVWKRALNRTTRVTMVLYDRGGGKRTRSLMEYGKKTGDEAYKVLILFKTPPDLRDVGFLIHARSFTDRDLWAYFPEFKRIRRIPDTNQDDPFFGSDFSYDDFGGPPNLDDYRYDILREESVDGMPAYVVEVTPKVRRKFSRYVSWISKEHWVHLKAEYYREQELYRTGSFRDIRVVDSVPTPFRMEMENRKTGHRTEIIINDVQYRTNHPDSLFTQRALEQGGK